MRSMTMAIRRRIAVRPLAHSLRTLITVGSFEVVPALPAVGGDSPPFAFGPVDSLDGCSVDHHGPGFGVGTRGSTGSAARRGRVASDHRALARAPLIPAASPMRVHPRPAARAAR